MSGADVAAVAGAALGGIAAIITAYSMILRARQRRHEEEENNEELVEDDEISRLWRSIRKHDRRLDALEEKDRK